MEPVVESLLKKYEFMVTPPSEYDQYHFHPAQVAFTSGTRVLEVETDRILVEGVVNGVPRNWGSISLLLNGHYSIPSAVLEDGRVWYLFCGNAKLCSGHRAKTISELAGYLELWSKTKDKEGIACFNWEVRPEQFEDWGNRQEMRDFCRKVMPKAQTWRPDGQVPQEPEMAGG